ncbi:MAG TPA: tetratricopeptide repeat protein [Methylomirabilota bacterium]|nr:tetratricopeptide repeat protein [Methylomirabilota bacterium]
MLEARFLVPFLALAILTAALVMLRHRFPGGLAAWTHSAAVVTPVSGIVHSGNQLVSDRYSYLAGLGFALVAGYGVTWAAGQRRAGRLSGWVSAVATVGLALSLAALALGTWGQSGVWRDSETLWRWAVDQDPECARCQAILGEAIVYAADGGPARLDEGEAHVRRAIALRPSMAVSYYTLGTILLVRGQYGEAGATLSTYMRLAPGDFHGPARLALVYLVQDRPDMAMPLLQRARQLTPPGPAPAASRPREPETPGADPLFAQCLTLLGDEPEDLEYLGQALVRQGKSERAVASLLRAAELAPSAPGPRFWLVRAYEVSGQRERAREQLAVLRRLDPGAADRAPVR